MLRLDTILIGSDLKRKMTKKQTTNYSNAGKGDKSRITNKKKFDDNWDKIFKRKKNEKTINVNRD